MTFSSESKATTSIVKNRRPHARHLYRRRVAPLSWGREAKTCVSSDLQLGQSSIIHRHAFRCSQPRNPNSQPLGHVMRHPV